MRRIGIDYVSALQEITNKITINFQSGQNIQINESQDWGTGFQLKTDKMDSFLSTNNLNEINFDLFEFSKKILRSKTSNDNIVETKVIKNNINNIKKPYESKELIDLEIEAIYHIASLISGNDPSIRFNINLENEQIAKSFQSSEFIDVVQRYSRELLTVEIYSLKYAHRNLLKTTIGGINNESLNYDVIDAKISELLKDFHALNVARNSETGFTRAILYPDTSFSLVHESIGHGVEADQIMNGNSYLSNSRGYPVSSGLLNVTDDPNIQSNGWFKYDDEGVKAQGTQIIEEGVLVNFLHNKKTASMMQTVSTGNARSTSYLSPPEPRQTNLYIEPGHYSQEELLEELKNGIIIGSTSYASTSIYSGAFNIFSQMGYKVENGQIVHALGPINIEDYSTNVLQNITAIGRETEKIPSICLKADSRIHIGGIAPYLLIDNIYIR